MQHLFAGFDRTIHRHCGALSTTLMSESRNTSPSAAILDHAWVRKQLARLGSGVSSIER